MAMNLTQLSVSALILCMLLLGSAHADQSEVVFQDKTAELGLEPPDAAACWADFDNDGDLDLLSAGRLFENQGSENNWLMVRLFGDGNVVVAIPGQCLQKSV